MLVDFVSCCGSSCAAESYGRRVFDGLASQIDRDLCLRPTHVFDPLRRDEHTPTAPPVARVHNQIANRPRVIVDEQILDWPMSPSVASI